MATPPRDAGNRVARPKRPTATDVARRAGVSQATVSYVMNNTPHQVIPEPTRQRVLAAAVELGYTPSAAARMLVSGRSDVVLLLLPDWPIGLGVARLLDELSQAFAQHDLTFVIHPQVTARPVTELWKSITPAAILAYESFGETDLMAISRSGAELVIISDLHHGAGAMDRLVERTGRIQVEYLARAGHRHLGYAWPDNDRVLFFAQHRLDAVRAACAELGLPEPRVTTVPLTVDGAAAAIADWRAREPAVTAICAFNDEVALAILAGASLRVAVPDDLLRDRRRRHTGRSPGGTSPHHRGQRHRRHHAPSSRRSWAGSTVALRHPIPDPTPIASWRGCPPDPAVEDLDARPRGKTRVTASTLRCGERMTSCPAPNASHGFPAPRCAAHDQHRARRARAAGPEQIINGTFDNGLVGWTAYPTGAVVDGQGCISVPAGTGAYGAAISQQVALQAGGDVRAEVRHRQCPVDQRLRPGGDPVRAGPQLHPVPHGAEVRDPEHEHREVVHLHCLGGLPERRCPVPAGRRQRRRLPAVSRQRLPHRRGAAEVYQPNTGPRVRVNQVGYLPDGPKHATLVTDETDPVRWEVRNAAGRTVDKGWTRPAGVDASSGLNVATIDFSDVRRSGSGYTLVADGETSYPFTIGADIYTSLRPTPRRSSTPSAAAHRSSTRWLRDTAVRPGTSASIPTRATRRQSACRSAMMPSSSTTSPGHAPVRGRLRRLVRRRRPRQVRGERWHRGGAADAGVRAHPDRADRQPAGTAGRPLAIPESDNGVPDLLDEVRWELEWMLTMQVPAGEPYAGLAYHKVADANWTGLPTDPAAGPQPRYLFRPSTAAGLNLAAATAQGARLFERYDRSSPPGCCGPPPRRTRREKTPDLYAPAPDATLDPNPGSGPYDDDDVSDEFYWAAAELYLATGARTYRRDVLTSPHHSGPVFDAGGFSWNAGGRSRPSRPGHRPQPAARPRPGDPIGDQGRGRLPGHARSGTRSAARTPPPTAATPGAPTRPC